MTSTAPFSDHLHVPETLPTSAVIAITAALAIAIIEVFRRRRHEGELVESIRSQKRNLQTELDRREEYVGALARELMNPIAAIAYAARALQDGRSTIDLKSVAQGIAAEAASATELVRALGDAARAESRHLHLALKPVDVTHVARETVRSFHAASHRIEVHAPDSVVVRGDAEALAKVLRHLLSNAVTYAPPGTVDVEIEASPNAPAAVVAVRDRGPGVPEQERPLLFRKFARLSTAGGSVGAGLGLYVSRAIVEEHGGVLSVEWPSEGGSRFYFTVPLDDAPPDA